ncbi:MAG: DUF5320 domain-containing protein [Desulfobacula sp.]|jgi:hypothetical protein|nr:DUF5320 domain-containing protein [Desulfobacula sp.]MBT7261113.1 DUF5320 domain-containing protein [Desulfobacula sp.]
MPGKDTRGPDSQGLGTGRGRGNCKIDPGCGQRRQQRRNQAQNSMTNCVVAISCCTGQKACSKIN